MKTKNMTIGGNMYSKVWRSVQLALNKCDNSTFVPNERSSTCKTEDDIMKASNNTFF
jgi:hypothetical protein